MRKFIALLSLFLVTYGLFWPAVEAARFGGGRSFGYQRSASNYTRPAPAAQPRPAQSNGASKWLGPLAGLAAGGLLASLFMGHGLGSGILSWLLVLGGGLMVWSLIRKYLRPTAFFNSSNQSAASFTPLQNVFTSTSHTAPVGFDEMVMLREAKVQFIRLQAAYDSKNLADLREFSTPEILAETQLQFQERGDAHNQTEVVKLEAELLDVTTESHCTIASVCFSGLIRENPAESAISFQETWHFKKENAETRWLVAGIQQ